MLASEAFIKLAISVVVMPTIPAVDPGFPERVGANLLFGQNLPKTA